MPGRFTTLAAREQRGELAVARVACLFGLTQEALVAGLTSSSDERHAIAFRDPALFGNRVSLACELLDVRGPRSASSSPPSPQRGCFARRVASPSRDLECTADRVRALSSFARRREVQLSPELSSVPAAAAFSSR